MSQSIFCCICNNKAGVTNIFTGIINSNTGQTLASLLGEILNKPLQENSLHSRVICKKCHKICTEYESIKLRSQAIKSDFTDQFKETVKKHNLSYDSICTDTLNSPAKSTGNSTPKKIGGKVVLPASKLQPLPPDYIINLPKLNFNQKLKMVTKTMPITPKASTTTIKTDTKQSKTNQDKSITLDNLILNTSTSNSMLSFNINALPKEYLNSSVMKGELKDEVQTLDDNEEQSMEIDSDCTLVRVSSVNDLLLDENDSEKDSSEKSKYIDVRPLGQEDRERIFGKFQPLNEENDDDDDSQTILMAEKDGEIMRISAGQKLIYENGELSIVAEEDEASRDEDYNDADTQDSNEESQIELQVSGDEETANAIIAAAQEKGGAFIKVETGEMYRVQSIESKSESIDDSQFQFVSHVEGHFKCLVCENNGDPLGTTAELYDTEEMMQHLKSEHGARLYICRVCKKTFRKRADYTMHIEEHNPAYKVPPVLEKPKQHSCNICNKKFNSKTFLTEHMNVHNGTRPYTCAVCNKSFTSKYTLQAHLKTHAERPRPFKCTKCPKTFLTQQNLTQHIKTHSGIKDFVCKVCGKAFGTQHNLEVHSIVHTGHKPFVCGVCNKGFARRAEVKDHMRIHTGERPFACEVCGATFTQRSNLHSHRRATHMNDKRYHCTQCDKRFKRRRLLDYHIQGSHTGERPLRCEHCHATFVYPEHYKKHIRIHSGEKPYVCEVCGKKFNSRDNRNTHRFTHSDKKPYECLVCGAGFMRKQLLYAHMNQVGHIAESIVVNQPRVHKVQAFVDANKSPDKLQTIFENSQDVETESVTKSPGTSNETSKLFLSSENGNILQDENEATLSLMQDAEDGAFISIQNLEGSKSEDVAASIQAQVHSIHVLQNVTSEQLTQAEMVATDQKGGMVRLVQIQLENGSTGWMAITD